MATEVYLNRAECSLAEKVAKLRMRSSGNAGRDFARSVERTTDQRLEQEIVGALAEIGVARHLGVAPSLDLNRFHDVPDVRVPWMPGGGVDVRATARRLGRMIVRDDDPPYRPIVFATVEKQEVTIHGWLPAAVARSCRDWKANPHGKRICWMVPASALRPLAVLPGRAGEEHDGPANHVRARQSAGQIPTGATAR
jgi:hypothetical protein